MKRYSYQVEILIRPYILLPENKREKYAKYFSEQFSIVLRLVEDDIPEVLILSIIKILRKCLVVLEDENAEYLEK